ncbi:MAG: lipopolysaccharide assembly protein LapA domain-containing protein [Myxococcota bacterium]
MQEQPARRKGRNWRLWIYATLWLLLAVVVLQNLEPTRIDLLFWSVAEVPKLVLILVSMAVGVALWELGALLLGLRRWRRRERAKR